MDRPNKKDFKVNYVNGDAELCSVTKQYSRAQDEYIDYLVESKLKNNGDLGDVVDQRKLLISFMEFRDEIYWGENEFTESKDIIELWLKRNK